MSSRADAAPRGDGATAAVIDVGTNTVLLYVARRTVRGSERVLEACRTPRLGEGLAARGELSDAAAERALAVIGEFAGLARAHGVAAHEVRAVGTEALRRARNAAAWIERCARETRVRVRVVEPELEAELAFEAVSSALADPACARVLDVGGGSAQVAWERGARRVSYPLGAVVLAERECPSVLRGAVTPDEWRRLCAAAEIGWRALPADARVSARGDVREDEVVWIGGSATHAACFAQGLERYDPERGDGARVSREQLTNWAHELAALDLAARAKRAIEPERVGILPVGFASAAAALASLGASSARVSLRGLRHALAERVLRESA